MPISLSLSLFSENNSCGNSISHLKADDCDKHEIIESKFYALSVERKKETSTFPAVWSESKTSPIVLACVQLFCPMQRNIIWYIYTPLRTHITSHVISPPNIKTSISSLICHDYNIYPCYENALKTIIFKYTSICMSTDLVKMQVRLLWKMLFPSYITLKNLGYKII